GEFHSPRDYDGHGSHTASTAAGDYGVPMTVDGKDFGKFSGVAPAARVAMYKALWHKADGTASGNNSDINKAIDEAVGDGVDVGIGLGSAVPSSPLVLSTDAALSGADATSARLCFSKTWDPAHPEGFLDPAKVAGKIVVCDRGTSDRVDKSKAVKEAGGVGMVLANTSPNSLNVDFHSVPTVHVSDTDGAPIKAYVSGTANPTASLSASVKKIVEAPSVASF